MLFHALFRSAHSIHEHEHEHSTKLASSSSISKLPLQGGVPCFVIDFVIVTTTIIIVTIVIVVKLV
jgi:uncharacterized membrane protein